MSVPETLERWTLRHVLRALTNRIKNLEIHEFDQNEGESYGIHVLPMDLEQTNSMPIFFTPCSASLLLNPGDDYEEAGQEFHDFDSFHPDDNIPVTCAYWLTDFVLGYLCACLRGTGHEELYELGERWSEVSIDDTPFKGLHQFQSPEWVTRWAIQVAEGSQPHVKAFVYHNMNGTDGRILRGEVLVALHLIIAQLRRTRFIEQLTAPVLLFSLMGPQHARLVEAYFNGTSLAVRPTRLFDLRRKDWSVIKTFGQWYYGMPAGDTTQLWSSGSRSST